MATATLTGSVYARLYVGPAGNRTNLYGAFSIRVTGKVGKGGEVKAGGEDQVRGLPN